MTFAFASFSIKGQHAVNQDSVLSPRSCDRYTLFAIADGVGGHARGELASSVAVKGADACWASAPSADVRPLFAAAKAAVDAEFAKEPDVGTLSTTLTLVIYDERERRVHLGHVGDCRLYHLSGSGIATRTRDQTEAQQLVDEGVLRPEQVARYRRRNVLTSAISSKRGYDLAESTFTLLEGDRLVLCSDGFYSVVKKREIVAHSLASSVPKLAQDLESLAQQRIPNDDCTALITEFH
ncbi:PP2C family protein-serine/threonine phosphatase [Paraburkholderia youngii]|uniref:PP2C family protein-serine/threonine phosphatase n=1 Tax=Paraburkholderia youngii TaxID=2782701 RepID=UPI0015900791|nr:PP2C family serine/threonine-protein phosphatase [Paraburkholderia youngii]